MFDLPEEIIYKKEKDRVRTTRINSFFEPIPQLVSFLNGHEKSHPFKDGSNSRLVDPTGQFSNHIIPDLKLLAGIVAETHCPLRIFLATITI